jgi:mannose-1-phosphate guanylyltransferase
MRDGELRALVLAAGRGERLRPLSEQIPKPLLPVLGVPIVERTLGTLAACGVGAAAVNLFHLGERIRERLGAEVGGMPLTYRPETELLGTLGPLAGLHGFFGDCDPVLLVNGDSLCRWPVGALVRAHRVGRSAATLLLAASPEVEAFNGGVRVDGSGRVLSFRGVAASLPGRRGVFAGLHAISPGLLRGIEAVPSDIVRDLYEPALAGGVPIRAVFTSRRWHDLGTPRRYLEGVLDEARSLGSRGSGGSGGAGDGWRHPGADVGEARVRGSVLEEGARVEAGAVVEGSLLMAEAIVRAGARVSGSIVGPGVDVPAGSVVTGLLLTRGESGTGSTPL